MPVRRLSVSSQTSLRIDWKPFGRPSVNGDDANSAVATGWSASDTRSFFTMSASDEKSRFTWIVAVGTSCRDRDCRPSACNVSSPDNAFSAFAGLRRGAISAKIRRRESRWRGPRRRRELRGDVRRFQPPFREASRPGAPDSSNWPPGSRLIVPPFSPSGRFRAMTFSPSLMATQP